MSKILQYLQEKVVFLPIKLDSNYEYFFDKNFKELNFETSNNGNINALHFTVENSKGVILYFHGNAGNLVRWGKEASAFTDFRYDILVMDYRSYGKSTGPKSEKILFEDAQFCYDYLKKIYRENQIIVYGISLGGAFAAKIASENSPKKVILECTFCNLQDMAARWIPEYATQKIKPKMTYIFESDKYIQKIKVPLYIFHGTKDVVVPIESGKKLFENFEKSQPQIEKKFIEIENGNHSDLHTFDLYQREMKTILE
ncbi:alpha/beta hydrolase [Frigoriflavimonas asaccharolytica]|uniref:AB hydrolase-1 domain-containing protein n=1 Tax=Frigoriflavimonas asaccharolytica TaxID=2735899 RepID=A0A8J8K972_9FLAO|nr:alpha/beta hydrolase [Frigoriflavimonas asaccharolytica]NRS92762.1 hypothetical protein [Frigoriflavimonas asaccharolytica]